jgi:thioredoxin 1
MELNNDYPDVELPRAEVDALQGPVVLEFGAPWCGFCMAARPHISASFSAMPGLRHLRFEDGKGRPLGRSYRVKLWPTLIFLRDGAEVARIVRPNSRAEVDSALQKLE